MGGGVFHRWQYLDEFEDVQNPSRARPGVDGQIVLSPGDVLLPFNTYVQTPVTLR